MVAMEVEKYKTNVLFKIKKINQKSNKNISKTLEIKYIFKTQRHGKKGRTAKTTI